MLALAPQVPVRTTVAAYPLAAANAALERVRAGGVEGSTVLVVDDAAVADTAARSDG